MATRPWLPKDIASCIAWWDAGQGITASGGSVSQWLDVISGLPATAAAATQPTFSATAQNGQPGLVFTGGKYLNFTPTSAFPTGASPGSIGVSAYVNSSGNSNSGVLSYGAGSTYNWRSIGLASNGNNVFLSLYGSDTSTNLLWASVSQLVLWTLNGTAAVGYANTTPYSFTTATPATTLAQGAIGRYNFGGQQTFQGVIQQVCFFNAILSTDERQRLEGWESWYTGKNGSNLPANHPYKAAAPTVDTGGGTVVVRRRPLLLLAS